MALMELAMDDTGTLKTANATKTLVETENVHEEKRNFKSLLSAALKFFATLVSPANLYKTRSSSFSETRVNGEVNGDHKINS